jgi:hypothetical protein
MGKRGGGSGDVAEYMVELQVHLAGKRVSDGKVLCCKTRQVKHHCRNCAPNGRQLAAPRKRLLWRVLGA